MAIRNDLGLDGQLPMAVDGVYDGILPPAPPAPANTVRVAQSTASTPPVIVTIALENGNVARLPDGTDISNVRANGADLQFVQPDGTVIVVTGGAISTLILFIGDVQIPAEAVELMFTSNGIEPAAAPEGGEPDGTGSYIDLGEQNVGVGFRQNSLLGDTGFGFASASAIPFVEGNTVPEFPSGGIVVTLSEEGLSGGLKDSNGVPGDDSDVAQVLDIAFGLVDGQGNDLSYSMLGLPTVNWTSRGETITWALTPDGSELIGSTINGDVVVVSFNNVTDSYTVRLEQPLDHPNKGAEDRLELTLDIRVADFQNFNDGKLILRFEDDSPKQTSETDTMKVVGEDDLATLNVFYPLVFDFWQGSLGTSPYDGNPADGITGLLGTVPVWGGLAPLVDPGADGHGKFSLIAESEAKTWLSAKPLTSKDDPVDDVRAITIAGIGDAMGFFADGRLVFGLFVSEDGIYNFRLFDQIDHDGVGPDLLPIDLSGLVRYEDGDGDWILLKDDSFVVTVRDDVPKAIGKECATLDEDDLASFNILYNIVGPEFWQGSLGTSPFDGFTDDGSVTGLLGTVSNWGFLGDNVRGGADEFGRFDLIDEADAEALLTQLGTGGYLKSHGDIINNVESIEIFDIGEAMGFFASDGRLVMGLYVDAHGIYNVRLFDQIDHGPEGSPTDDQISVDFGQFVRYTDRDDDEIDLGGHFEVKLVDDEPLRTNKSISATFDEAHLDNFNVLTAALQIADSLGITHDVFLELPAWLRVVGSDGTSGSLPPGQGGIADHLLGTVSQSGFLNELVVGGADEFGKFDVKTFADATALDAALKALGPVDYLYSNGEKINKIKTFDLDIGGVDLGTVMGFFSDDGRLIFTVSVATTLGIGAYDIRLFDQVDHLGAVGQDDKPANLAALELDLGQFVTYTDYDKDQIDFGGQITLTIKDDTPDLVGSVDLDLHEAQLGNFNFITAAAWLADDLNLIPGAFAQLSSLIPVVGSIVGSNGTNPGDPLTVENFLGTEGHAGLLNHLVVDGADEFGRFKTLDEATAESLLASLGPNNGFLYSNKSVINDVKVLDLAPLGNVMGFFAADGRLVFTLSVAEFGGYDVRLFDQIDHDQDLGADIAFTLNLGQFVQYTDADGDTVSFGANGAGQGEPDHIRVTVFDDNEPEVRGSVTSTLNEAALETWYDEALPIDPELLGELGGEGLPAIFEFLEGIGISLSFSEMNQYLSENTILSVNLNNAWAGVGLPFLAFVGSSGNGDPSENPLRSFLGTDGVTGIFNQLIPPTFVAGADEFGKFGLIDESVANGAQGPNLVAQLGLKSQGDLINRVDTFTIPGLESLGKMMMFFASDGRMVFTVIINELGIYDVRLFDQIDHGEDGSDTDDLLKFDLGAFVTYTDADNDSVSLEGHFFVEVNDDSPIAENDTALPVVEGGTITIDVAANDSVGADEGSAPRMTFSIVSVVATPGPAPAPGSLPSADWTPEPGDYSIDEDGRVTINQPQDWFGTIEVTYQVTDEDGDTDTATATVLVTPFNDLPDSAEVGPLTGAIDTPLLITLSGTDKDGTVASFVITSGPANGALYYDDAGTQPVGNLPIAAANGTASVYFVPNPGYFGSPTFSYAAVDNEGGQDPESALVSIVIPPPENEPPVGTSDAVFTNVDVNSYILIPIAALLSNELTGDPEGFSIAFSDSSAGTVEGDFLRIQVTGATTNFTYRVTDGDELSDPISVVITRSTSAPTPTGSTDIFAIKGNSTSTSLTVNGSGGEDYLVAMTGRTTLRGGDGNDTLVAGTGTDTLEGQGQNDTYVFRAGSSAGQVASAFSSLTNFDTIIGFNVGDKIILPAAPVAAAPSTNNTGTLNTIVYGLFASMIIGSTGVTKFYSPSGIEILLAAGDVSANFAYNYLAQNDIGAAGATLSFESLGSTYIYQQGGETASDGPNTIIKILGQTNINLYAAVGNSIDPLILDLDNNGFNLAAATHFDLDHDGNPDHLGWPGAGDGILVADLDNSGAIENGNEVFSPEFGEGGHKDSLAALATYDSNGDGKITADDAGFGDLKVWQDLNGDGITDAGELSNLSDLGIVEIDLGADEVDWTEDGQHVFASGSFTTADGQSHDYIGVDLGVPFTATQTGTDSADIFAVGGSALEYIADYDFDGGDKVDLSDLLGDLGGADAADYVKLEGDTLKVDQDGAGTEHGFQDVATFSSTQQHVTLTFDSGFDILVDKG